MMPAKKKKLEKPMTELKVRVPEGSIRRNIDYGADLHSRLEAASEKMNISSQALVKVALQEWLDRFEIADRYYSEKARTGT